MTQQHRDNLKNYFVKKMTEEEKKEDTRNKGLFSCLVQKYKKKHV